MKKIRRTRIIIKRKEVIFFPPDTDRSRPDATGPNCPLCRNPLLPPSSLAAIEESAAATLAESSPADACCEGQTISESTAKRKESPG